MARLMLRGPKRPSSPTKKLMASPTTIIKSSGPKLMSMASPVKLQAPTKQAAPSTTVKPSAPVPSFTERLKMMADTMNKPKLAKDLKPEQPTPIAMDKPKRKVPVKRSAAIRKVKKVAVPRKK